MGSGTARVAGLVLAAGRSTRMGRSKARLEAGGRTFVEACVAALRGGGCDPVLAVVGTAADADAARAAGAGVVEGRPEGEQVDSLRSGLDALEGGMEADRGLEPGVGLAAVAVLPVDHPLVEAATVTALIAAWRDRPGAIVRPVHGGRPGHPTLFPRPLWPRLRDPALPLGARSVVEAEETEVVDVAVDDPGVAADIDTPAEYRRRLGRDPS